MNHRPNLEDMEDWKDFQRDDAVELGDKCIVFGCSNHTSQGRFVGVLCAPCHHYLTTGKIGHTDSFLGNIRKAIEILERVKA